MSKQAKAYFKTVLRIFSLNLCAWIAAVLVIQELPEFGVLVGSLVTLSVFTTLVCLTIHAMIKRDT